MRGRRSSVKAAKVNIKGLGKVRASSPGNGGHGRGKGGKKIQVQINSKGG